MPSTITNAYLLGIIPAFILTMVCLWKEPHSRNRKIFFTLFSWGTICIGIVSVILLLIMFFDGENRIHEQDAT